MFWWTLRKLKSKNPETRIKAVQKLGRAGNTRVIEPLIEALKDENIEVQDSVETVLVEIGATAVAPLIITHWDKNENMEKKSVVVLRKIGIPAVEMLIMMLKHENSIVRQRAAEALKEIGAPLAVEALIMALDNFDTAVYEIATEALGEIGDIRAVLPLIESLKDLMRGKQAFDALGNTLLSLRSFRRYEIRDVEEDVLYKIVQLEDNIKYKFCTDHTPLTSRVWEGTLDCSQIKELAQQELNRRGLKV